MANTNTNTSTDPVISTDIYEISEFIDQIRTNNVPDIDGTASVVGIFGYMNEIFSQTLQNTLIVVSETSNEAIPIRAKFTKNIISHTLNYGITDILATPAIMTLMIYMPLTYIEANYVESDPTTGKAKFIFDKDVPIFIDSYEFHLDYDVIINRIKVPSGEYVYSAMYDLFEAGTTSTKQQNPISDITNPYINTLVKYNIDNTEYLAFSARLHQVSNIYQTKTILTNNEIENKTITFTFDEQLAAFDLDVEENGKVTHLTPIYSGLLDYTVEDGEWCYYEYLNENTIRIIFDRDSYLPSMNANVTINIKLTEGANGNFTYNKQFRCSMKSEKYNNYNGMYLLIYPLLNGVSNRGRDKKSIDTLKKIIPREASSRGAIINTTDLQNYFNSINDEHTKIYFKKKRDNPFERLYYSHMLMRKNAIVYPTNTLNLRLEQSDFNGNNGNNNLSINPGTVFYYYDHGSDVDNDFASLNKPEYVDVEDGLYYNMTTNVDGNKVRVFEYISPFLITIDDDLISSYLLTIMNDNKTFKFEDINTSSDLQFVATNMQWRRKFIYRDSEGNDKVYDNKYTMDIDITQNNNINYGLVKWHNDLNGEIQFDDIRVKTIMVLYADETDNNPYRYIEGTLVDYDEKNFVYNFNFTLETDDLMDLNNRINIKGIYNAKPEEFQKLTELENSHGYLNNNTYAKLFILADFGIKVGDKINGTIVSDDMAKDVLYGTDGKGNRSYLETIIPVREDIVEQFLKNNIYLNKDGKNLNVCTIMKSNPEYIAKVKAYNNDEQETEAAILKYLRNNRNSEFVNDVLLNDDDVNAVIDSYKYNDLHTYTVCNVLSVVDGIDFYYDYSNIMSSIVNVRQIQEKDENGDLLYREVDRTDSLGNPYKQVIPIYKVNENGNYYYEYDIKRIPMIKNSFLDTQIKMEDFIYDLEERRKYISECIKVLEDTFAIDLKFFNTYGPSKMFYYDIPDATTYNAKVILKTVNVYDNTVDEDNMANVVGTLEMGDVIEIIKVKGQWGYIKAPFEGWVKISSTKKIINYINNVALDMKYSLEAQTSADKYIGANIVSDIKDYIEDINVINELHIPNIITLITNNYREQLVYFEFLNVNGYGPSCQHIYLDQSMEDYTDICPEFLNIGLTEDGLEQPEIDITIY